jgi:hypothetical protein
MGLRHDGHVAWYQRESNTAILSAPRPLIDEQEHPRGIRPRGVHDVPSAVRAMHGCAGDIAVEGRAE